MGEAAKLFCDTKGKEGDRLFFIGPNGEVDLRWVFDSCITYSIGDRSEQFHNLTEFNLVHNSTKPWSPDAQQCIAISTTASIKEMILPGVYAIWTPVFVGFLV